MLFWLSFPVSRFSTQQAWLSRRQIQHFQNFNIFMFILKQTLWTMIKYRWPGPSFVLSVCSSEKKRKYSKPVVELNLLTAKGMLYSPCWKGYSSICTWIKECLDMRHFTVEPLRVQHDDVVIVWHDGVMIVRHYDVMIVQHDDVMIVRTLQGCSVGCWWMVSNTWECTLWFRDLYLRHFHVLVSLMSTKLNQVLITYALFLI